ncbi:MAG TPA: IS200/IS605 family transposase [Thermoanaerobaculia bacterium]|nr:IS200/IS605 family transposase [Thermoanaerobaculia bacterium]
MPNTFTSLRYHIIFATKNREPFLEPPLRERMHAYLGGCARTIGCVLLEIGGVSDHVHLLLGLKPTHCVSDVLCSIKKVSSEWVRHEIGVSKFHWQDGYSAFTVGRKIDALRRYIATQEEHHQTRSFEEEYREFLTANGIEFDERYLL